MPRFVDVTDKTVARSVLNAASASLHPAGSLRCWGHSIMRGSSTSTGGAVKGTSDQSTLIAAGLGLPLDNRSVSGASLYNSVSDADWASIAQDETRPSKFAPVGGVYAIQYGINDASYIGHTISELLPYRHALRASIARLRCAALFQDNDATVTLGGSGTWVRGTSTAHNSGNGFSYNVTSGATITITTPLSFPGGTLDLFFVAWNDGLGGTVTGPVSLGSPTLATGDFAHTDGKGGGVMRIEDVPAGSASYVFTTSSVSGSAGVIFDSWGWEPPENVCAFVAVLSMPKPIDYSSQSGAPAGEVTDDGVDNLNTVHSDVVAEFGDRCTLIDLSYLDHNDNGTFWEAANIHYSATGHAYAAQQTIAWFDSFDLQFLPLDANPSSAVPDADPEWTSYTPTLAGITIGSGTVAAAYRTGTDGMVDFYVRITLAADSSVTGTTTVTLPANMANAYATVASNVTFIDTGSTHYTGKALALALDKWTVCGISTAGVKTNLAAGSPFTWATGDIIDVGGRYRAS